MLIESRDHLDPELATLLTALQRELSETGLVGEAADPAGHPSHADTRYLVGAVNGRGVACGGLRRLDAGTAEIRQMYVRPGHRGRGVARQILAALEELAFLAGHLRVRLETGCQQSAAVRLYASSGYAEIPRCGGFVVDPYSVCFEKRLPVAA
nr:GNAT family N-acetyltransferase [Micromonospora sp. DSM 115978]